jgi:hypothetical protein
MRAPDSLLLLGTALAVALLPVAGAWWRIQKRRSVSGLQVAVAAVGVALTTLLVLVSSTYALLSHSAAASAWWPAAASLLAYGVSGFAVGRRVKVEYGSLGLWLAAGAVPLVFLGFYAWLLAACNFGNCL